MVTRSEYWETRRALRATLETLAWLLDNNGPVDLVARWEQDARDYSAALERLRLTQ